MNAQLSDNVQFLNLSNELLSISEKKYRSIVEGSADGIFTISSDGEFLSYNGSLLKMLNVQKEDIVDKHFTDFVYDDTLNGNVMKPFVDDKIHECMESVLPVVFKIAFYSKYMTEPKELNVRLEHITIEERQEILGKLSNVDTDELLPFFVSEVQRHEINNHLITAEEISQRLVRNLEKYMLHRDVSIIKIGLREIIVNAIEHGNLNISFEEKKRAVIDGTYMKMLLSRQADPAHKFKKVTIEYSLSPDLLTYCITDEGNGFDKSVLNRAQEEELICNGRGIMMAKNIFDSVEYSDKGNSVTLTKKIIPLS